MIRAKSRLRHPKRGPGRHFVGSRSDVFPTNTIFPASIWTTLAVQKRRSLDRRIRTKSGFVKPIRFTPPVLIQVFPEFLVPVIGVSKKRVRLQTRLKTRVFLGKPTVRQTVTQKPVRSIRVVSLTKFRRNKPQVKVHLGIVFGKPTRAPIPQRPRTLVQAVKRAKLQVRTKTVLGRIPRVTQVVIVVRPQRIRFVSLPATTSAKLRRTTKTRFTRAFGKQTTRTVVRPIQVLSFANKEATRKRRFVPVKIVVGRIPRTFGSSPVGSVIIFFDGLNVADGLTYHHGLARPHITLTPSGGGRFNVVKDSQVTEEKSDSILKETYLIDGDIP